MSMKNNILLRRLKSLPPAATDMPCCSVSTKKGIAQFLQPQLIVCCLNSSANSTVNHGNTVKKEVSAQKCLAINRVQTVGTCELLT